MYYICFFHCNPSCRFLFKHVFVVVDCLNLIKKIFFNLLFPCISEFFNIWNQSCHTRNAIIFLVTPRPCCVPFPLKRDSQNSFNYHNQKTKKFHESNTIPAANQTEHQPNCTFITFYITWFCEILRWCIYLWLPWFFYWKQLKFWYELNSTRDYCDSLMHLNSLFKTNGGLIKASRPDKSLYTG